MNENNSENQKGMLKAIMEFFSKLFGGGVGKSSGNDSQVSQTILQCKLLEVDLKDKVTEALENKDTLRAYMYEAQILTIKTAREELEKGKAPGKSLYDKTVTEERRLKKDSNYEIEREGTMYEVQDRINDKMSDIQERDLNIEDAHQDYKNHNPELLKSLSDELGKELDLFMGENNYINQDAFGYIANSGRESVVEHMQIPPKSPAEKAEIAPEKTKEKDLAISRNRDAERRKERDGERYVEDDISPSLIP